MNNNPDFKAPRKSLGQNFLQDPDIVRNIVASLAIKPSDTVLEIGPGRGALTDLILPCAKQTHVVEFDRDLAQYWRARSDTEPRLVVHESDILKFDLKQIVSVSKQEIKVIGNLPYNISSPVLFHLMKSAELVDTQLFMLQKEVVQRLSAQPGSKQFGRLSVMLQYRYNIENLFTVPPNAFFPHPKVDSAIARLTPRAAIENQVVDLNHFSFIVKQAFAQRRKTLRNTLKGHLSSEQIEGEGINPAARAETLSVDDFVNLSNLFTKDQVEQQSAALPK